MPEIQRADPQARRKTIILILMMMVVFVPILYWANSRIDSVEEWVAQPGETIKRAKLILSVLIAFGAILLLVISIFTFGFASAILRSDRYPPPKIKVVKDIRIRRGVAARKIGRLMQALGIASLLLLMALILVGWRLIQEVDQMAI
ncbi:MAG: hypothetical protein OEQ39_23055 [Gammaproteobacteria bacterium]|nr:hypothetical protein [Gammaproteobacteria bacterium]